MDETNHINVNHEVLLWARESLALNRTRAAEITDISVKRLEQLEEGDKQPSFDELKGMAKAYKRTIATLLLQVPPLEKPLPPDRRTVDSKELGKFHEKTIVAVRKARALAESLVELKQDAGISITRFQHRASIQDTSAWVARRLRAELEIDEIRQLENNNHALDAYIDKVESLGVAVFQLSLTQDNLRGFSIVDEAVPIIGIKRGGEPATAKIFTLFHELGHIILNEGGLCDLSESTTQQVEKWCNSFAAEILIPATELLKLDIVADHRARNEKVWSKNDLITIGNYFHAGPLAILRSLLENNLTTQAYYKEKHGAWNKPSFGRAKVPEGRNIPKETIKEKGRTYLRLAFQAFDLNRIDLKDLSDFLGVRLSYIPETRQLLDTNALINLEASYKYNNPVFTAIWEEVEDLIKQGTFKTIDFVEDEINNYEGKQDFLKNWVKTWRKLFVVATDAASINAAIPIINEEYASGFFDAKKQAEGKEEADPYLIAYCKTHHCVLITNESKLRPNKIPAVSAKNGVKCIDIPKFLEERGMKMERKKNLL